MIYLLTFQLIIIFVTYFYLMYISKESTRLKFRLAVLTGAPLRLRSHCLTVRMAVGAIVCMIALALVLFASGTALAQSAPSLPNAFGSRALPVGRTPMDQEWQSVRQGHIPANDESLVSLISQNRMAPREEQVASVNSWVNQKLAYVADQANYGQPDRWVSASQSLRSGRGDCEDFAIAKYQILLELGVSEQDIYLIIGRDRALRADHAVLAVRVGSGFRILDNVTDRVLDDGELIDFLPMFSYSSSRTWIYGLPADRSVPLARN